MGDPELKEPTEQEINAFKEANILTPVERTRKKIFDDRVKSRKEKAQTLIKHYQDRLQEYINLYFQSQSDEPGENEKAFEIINKEWKDLCHKVNSTQKIIKLGYEAFEKNIESIKKKIQEKEVKPEEPVNE